MSYLRCGEGYRRLGWGLCQILCQIFVDEEGIRAHNAALFGLKMAKDITVIVIFKKLLA